jgi:hypothetical protein
MANAISASSGFRADDDVIEHGGSLEPRAVRAFEPDSHGAGLCARLCSLPASPGDIVAVRLYEHDLEILDGAAPPSPLDETRTPAVASFGSSTVDGRKHACMSSSQGIFPAFSAHDPQSTISADVK